MGLGWQNEGEWWIRGKECILMLSTRPIYCDRGNYMVYLEAWGELGRLIDDHDMWPRIYFGFDVAMAEGIAWLKTRQQFDDKYSAWFHGCPTATQLAQMRGS